MLSQTSTAQRPDDGAALILGGVLGLLLASAAAVAVGGWQYWKSQVSVVPAASVPVSQGVTGYPASSQPYGASAPAWNTSPYAAPVGAPNPYPATSQPGPQPTVPHANSNHGPDAPAQASAVAPFQLPPDESNSVELPTEDTPADGDSNDE